MIEKITPLILTYNEAPNIKRTLEHLGWAKTIITGGETKQPKKLGV